MKMNPQYYIFKPKIQKNILILLIALLLWLCLFSNIVISGEDESVRLENGEILLSKINLIGLDNISRRRAKAVMLISAPISQVTATILDHNHYATFMPSVVDCKIVEETKASRVVAYRVKMGFMEVFCHLRWVFALEKKSSNKIHIECYLDNKFPSNVVDIQGTWDLEPLLENTQTKVTYTVYMKSGRLIPKFIEMYLSRKQLPKIMKNVRNRVMSGGIWKKGDDDLITSKKAIRQARELSRLSGSDT